MCSWDLPATLLLRLALQSSSDFILTYQTILFPHGPWVETSPQVTVPHISSDFSPLLFVPDETPLNAAVQHWPILLCTL